MQKDVQHRMSLGNCKFQKRQQQQTGTTTHLLEWPQSRTLTTSKAGKDRDKKGILIRKEEVKHFIYR